MIQLDLGFEKRPPVSTKHILGEEIRRVRFGGGLLARQFHISDLGQSPSPLGDGLGFHVGLHHSSEKLLDHLAAFDGLTHNPLDMFRFDAAVPDTLSCQR